MRFLLTSMLTMTLQDSTVLRLRPCLRSKSEDKKLQLPSVLFLSLVSNRTLRGNKLNVKLSRRPSTSLKTTKIGEGHPS